MIRMLLIVALMVVTRCSWRPAFASEPPALVSEEKYGPELLRVWKATDGSKWVWVKGEPHRISLPPPRVEWRDYLAYGAAVLADYSSSRALMRKGGNEVFYRCSPHRPGCLDSAKFFTVSGASLAGMIAWDVRWRSRSGKRWNKAQSISRKVNTGLRLAVAISNLAQ